MNFSIKLISFLTFGYLLAGQTNLPMPNKFEPEILQAKDSAEDVLKSVFPACFTEGQWIVKLIASNYKTFPNSTVEILHNYYNERCSIIGKFNELVTDCELSDPYLTEIARIIKDKSWTAPYPEQIQPLRLPATLTIHQTAETDKSDSDSEESTNTGGGSDTSEEEQVPTVDINQEQAAQEAKEFLDELKDSRKSRAIETDMEALRTVHKEIMSVLPKAQELEASSSSQTSEERFAALKAAHEKIIVSSSKGVDQATQTSEEESENTSEAVEAALEEEVVSNQIDNPVAEEELEDELAEESEVIQEQTLETEASPQITSPIAEVSESNESFWTRAFNNIWYVGKTCCEWILYGMYIIFLQIIKLLECIKSLFC